VRAVPFCSGMWHVFTLGRSVHYPTMLERSLCARQLRPIEISARPSLRRRPSPLRVRHRGLDTPAADRAFPTLMRYAIRMEVQGIRPDAIELFVDEERRPVRRGD